MDSHGTTKLRDGMSDMRNIPKHQVQQRPNEASAPNPDPWRKPSTAKEVPALFTLYSNAVETGYNKLTELQDINMRSLSAGSNHSEISKAMEKISEMNQLLAQQQMAQQKTLQALLYHQEQTSKVQEALQRIQSQALIALTEATQQKGFDPLFNKIAKYDGKDPKKCHYWLNQVWVACVESGRNFHQSLMFCAEDAVLAVLSGLNPGLMDEQVKEEIMRCFSPAPTRRQAIEKLRTMHQEPDEQMQQYIVRHEVAHLRAHRLTADEQCSTSEIIKFAINLQPFVQDKLLKKIDGNRLLRSLREAYDQALDLEHKNQITKRYEMSTQAHQIAECSIEVEFEGVEAMELHSCRENIEPQTTTTGSRRTSINLTVEVSTEKGEMMVTTEDHPLRTTTEVLEGELTEISIPNIRRTSNLPNGMHNFKHMALMVEQY